ncbi:MAG: hypothetical protein BMS9Abin22_127 [Gammaproteobacteria bacterium]|nr:MAG: hypothetical protein BMS9Abin22_127 [Gammaproteobacteria bacterium]
MTSSRPQLTPCLRIKECASIALNRPVSSIHKVMFVNNFQKADLAPLHCNRKDSLISLDLHQ